MSFSFVWAFTLTFGEVLTGFLGTVKLRRFLRKLRWDPGFARTRSHWASPRGE